MTNNYALEAGNIVLYSDGVIQSYVNINVNEALKTTGFSSKMPLSNGTIMELRLEDAIYAGKSVDLNVKKKFIY